MATSLPASRRPATTAVATAKTTKASATAATAKSAEPSAKASGTATEPSATAAVGHGIRQKGQPPEAANASTRTAATAAGPSQNHDNSHSKKDQFEDSDAFPSGAPVLVFRQSGQRNAAIGGDNLRRLSYGLLNGPTRFSLTEQGHHAAADVARSSIDNYRLQATAHLNPVLVLGGGKKNQQPASVLFVTDSHGLEQIVSVVLDGLVVQ